MQDYFVSLDPKAETIGQDGLSKIAVMHQRQREYRGGHQAVLFSQSVFLTSASYLTYHFSKKGFKFLPVQKAKGFEYGTIFGVSLLAYIWAKGFAASRTGDYASLNYMHGAGWGILNNHKPIEKPLQ